MKSTRTQNLIAASFVCAIALSAVAQAQPAAQSPQPTPSEYALGLLKNATDKLSAAKSFTFKTTSSVEVPSPVGQTINLFRRRRGRGAAAGQTGQQADRRRPLLRPLLRRQDVRGPGPETGALRQDGRASDARRASPLVEEKTGMQFPYADVLYSDVYATVTKDLTHAYWVGKTTVDGV